MAQNEVTLGYWGIRGRSGVVRSLLAYCGVPFKNKLYTDPNEWFGKDKQELGFDFPNLPYLIDGDKKITETSAILHYIPLRAGKRELIGDTDEKRVKIQTALGVIGDLSTCLKNLALTKEDFNTEKEKVFSDGPLKNKLDILNKNLEGKEWLCGSLSIADFELFELVDSIDEMDSTKLEKWPNLVAFFKRFNELPEYKAHKQTPEFISLWFPPGMMSWYKPRTA